MSNYIVASKSNNSKLAECQILGEFVEINAPDIQIKTIVKDKSEWAEFQDSVCRTYGFEKKCCPLVYTLEGTLIGDGAEFITHIKEKYGIALTITKESLKQRQKLNIVETEERMRKLAGQTLGEKILAEVGKKPKKNVTNLITDSFYHMEIEQGIPFYVRRTNVLRDAAFPKLTAKRVYNVPDSALEKEVADTKFKQQEEDRDQTWDEFLSLFGDHIEGKIDP